MSLISEALKEAQRSHSQRLTPKSPAPVGEAFFPYPEGRKPVRSSNKAFLVGGIAVAVLAVAAAVVARNLRRPSPVVPISHAPLVVNPPAAAPLASSPAASAPSAPSAPVVVPVVTAPARAAGDARPASAKPNGAPVSPSPQAAAPTVQPTTRAATDSAPARSVLPAVTPAPPALPPTQTQGAGGVHVVLDAGSSRSGDSLFKQAYAEQVRGNFGRSKELYEKAIALPQASAEAFNNYGVLLLQTGDQIGASEMFKQAVRRDDKNVDAWINLGDSYNAVGHHADALSAFMRAGQLDASNSALGIRMAAEYQAIGDTASARRRYDDAIKQSPRDPSVHFSFGKFLQTQRDYRGAIREYQAFVDLAPGKFSAEQIAQIRQYIINLSRYVP